MTFTRWVSAVFAVTPMIAAIYFVVFPSATSCST